ncbi:MAG: RagB/SusD family nutrient uptake outer membrane protein [Parabacteroides sp.]|nr:RagB/SusD family nutrient uptake outer membrane protein [Parabacteroides sp.]
MKLTKIGMMVIATAALLFNSSCNFLNVDDYFVDTFSYDSIFVNKINLNKYLWNIPTQFDDEGGIWGSNKTPGVCASGEAVVQWETGEYPGLLFALDRVTPDKLENFGDVWPRMYKIIRRCNTLLANIDKCQDLTTLEEREVLGYTYFMRAYAYYNLLVDYGPVVLMGDDLLETNETPEYYNRPRATFDESVDYICSEFEKAAQYMPLTVTVSQFGRPTRGAAYGLVARLRLMQASPSFNGGASARRYFADWKRSTDGVNYVSQEYDEKKWAIAAHAAKRVIDMGIYELHTVKRDTSTAELPKNVPDAPFPEGAGDIDPYKSYKDMFSGEAIAFKNPEFVWGRNSSQVVNYTKHSFPVLLLGGWNGMAVPQKFVDAYYMEDGRDIHESSVEYPYSETGFTTEAKNRSGYQQQSGIFNMYNNREWRFYANIGFSGCFWPCSSTSENNRKNKTVTYGLDGSAGKTQTDGNLQNYPITGYVTNKYIHKDDAWAGNDSERLNKAFGIIRYAEILLSYVEALNHLSGSQTVMDGENTYTYSRNEAEMAKYFNMIRYRVGLPGLTASQLSNPDVLEDVIEREWMVEFFHENRYYYNIRRWGTMEDCAREPIIGMNTEAKEKEGFYTRTTVTHPVARYRSADKKLIFLPISRNEIRKVPMMDQNPGWGN